MKQIRMILLFGVLFLSDNLCFAAIKDAFIHNADRPTMGELVDRLGPNAFLGANPFASPNSTLAQQWLPIRDWLLHRDGFAKALSDLEAVFPGAIWMPMGRDAVFFGDLLDAYYVSRGERGRVKRINLSGGTFQSLNHGFTLLQVLEAHGLDLRAPQPQVVLDRTSFNGLSQTNKVINTIYEALKQNGMNYNHAFNRFNVASITLTSKHFKLDSFPSPQDLIQTLYAAGQPLFKVTKIMEVDGRADFTSDLWHAGFDSIVQLNQGPHHSIVPLQKHNIGIRTSRSANQNDREAVLYFQFEVLQLFYKHHLGSVVENVALGRGYPIPPPPLAPHQQSMPSAASSTRTPGVGTQVSVVPIRDFDLELKNILAQFKPLPALPRIIGASQGNGAQPNSAPTPQGRFSSNAQIISNWLDVVVRMHPKQYPILNRANAAVLTAALEAYQQSYIDRRDLRYLVARTIAFGYKDPGFRKHFVSAYQGNQDLKDLWTDKMTYFLDNNPKRKYSLAVPRAFVALSKELGLSAQYCAHVF